MEDCRIAAGTGQWAHLVLSAARAWVIGDGKSVDRIFAAGATLDSQALSDLGKAVSTFEQVRQQFPEPADLHLPQPEPSVEPKRRRKS